MLGQVTLLFAICAAANAGLHGGRSTSSRHQDDFGNYAFNYDIVDPLGATNGRWEKGDVYGNKRGGYTLTDIDGRARKVEYIADAAGFRTIVNTNEPGTAASAPASAIIISPYSAPFAAPAYKSIAPVPALAAPVAYRAAVPVYGGPKAFVGRPYGGPKAFVGRPYGYGVGPGFYKG